MEQFLLMPNFITNSKKSDLKKRLVELISKSDELKFLVGFFYFSGIRELYSALKTNPEVSIKILVGLNVDRYNLNLMEYAETDQQIPGIQMSSNNTFNCGTRQWLFFHNVFVLSPILVVSSI